MIALYLGITTLATLAYVTSDRERLRNFTAPLVRLCVEPGAAAGALRRGDPAAGAGGLRDLAEHERSARGAGFGRTIHPAPPDSITVHDKPFDLVTLDNPYRPLEKSDPAAFARHVANGKRVFYQNCVYCHGDAMRGDGMYAHGLNPIPTNFAEGGTIALLQERSSSGASARAAPGCPRRAVPGTRPCRPGRSSSPRKRSGTWSCSSTTTRDQRPAAREVHE